MVVNRPGQSNIHIIMCSYGLLRNNNNKNKKNLIVMAVANMYVMSSFAIGVIDNRNQLIEGCKRLLMYNNNKINNNTSS